MKFKGLHLPKSCSLMTAVLVPFLCVVGLFIGSVNAAAAVRPVNIPVPPNMDTTEFYLLTVFRGEDLPARFGHTMVRVKDPRYGIDYLLNWGTFDFEAPNFGLNFYRGILNYHLSKAGIRRTLQYYEQYDKRGVIQERMVFTPKQKLTYLNLIRENALTQNLVYGYHQFYDNCATRIRDHLDQVFNGALKEKYYTAETGNSFRYRVREGFDGQWWSYLGIELTTNSDFDLPMTVWHDMFLPVALRDALKNFQPRDDEGQPLPGSFLVERETLVDLPVPPSGPNPVYISGGLAFLFFGLPLLGLLWKREPSRWQIRLGSLAGAGLGLWAAIFGTVYIVNWIVASQRPELHHNALLWLFGPWDWIVVAVMLRSAWRAQLPTWSEKSGKVLFCLGLAHIIGLCILLLARLSGIVTQDVWPVLLAWSPALLAAWVSIGSGFGSRWWAPLVQAKLKADDGQAEAV